MLSPLEGYSQRRAIRLDNLCSIAWSAAHCSCMVQEQKYLEGLPSLSQQFGSFIGFINIARISWSCESFTDVVRRQRAALHRNIKCRLIANPQECYTSQSSNAAALPIWHRNLIHNDQSAVTCTCGSSCNLISWLCYEIQTAGHSKRTPIVPTIGDLRQYSKILS
jgi:hypothetical protein